MSCNFELHCPRCEHTFNGKIWEGGVCPNCDNDYWFDEGYAEDYSDSWIEIYWGFYE